MDRNLKLLILDSLYFCDEDIKAQIDMIAAEGLDELIYADEPKYGWYACIPEVREKLHAIELAQHQLDKVSLLSAECCKTHFMVMPNWDGEGDEFAITSFAGIEIMKNLKSMQFIDFSKAIDLPRLLHIRLEEIEEHAGLDAEFIEQLRRSGVKVS